MADQPVSRADQAPCSANIRFKVDPGDVPPVKAARRMGLTSVEFEKKLPQLLARGFPPPDPTAGMFELQAIDRWRSARHCQTADLMAESKQHTSEEVFKQRWASRGPR